MFRTLSPNAATQKRIFMSSNIANNMHRRVSYFGDSIKHRITMRFLATGDFA